MRRNLLGILVTMLFGLGTMTPALAQPCGSAVILMTAESYGPAQIVGYSSGLICCVPAPLFGPCPCPPNGICESFICAFPIAHVYAVPAGSVGDGTAIAAHQVGVRATAVEPLFPFEFGATAPVGPFVPGEYDVIVDECQDGTFQAGQDSVAAHFVVSWCVAECPPDPDLDNPTWTNEACAEDDRWPFCLLDVFEKNCLNYAFNENEGSWRHPYDDPVCRLLNRPSMRRLTEEMGLIPSETDECTNGCTIALWVKTGYTRGCGDDRPAGGFHYARKNADGRWSHKPGHGSARLLDPPTPESQVPGPGYEFSGFFCIPCGYQPPGSATPVPPIPNDGVRAMPNSGSGARSPHYDSVEPTFLDMLRSALVSGSEQPPAPRPEGVILSGFIVAIGASVTGLPPIMEFRSGQIIYPTAAGLRAREDALGVSSLIETTGINIHGWGCLLRARCYIDINCDGFVNSQDFFDFIAAFFALQPRSDFNADGFINSQDFFDFIAAFFAGC